MYTCRQNLAPHNMRVRAGNEVCYGNRNKDIPACRYVNICVKEHDKLDGKQKAFEFSVYNVRRAG